MHHIKLYNYPAGNHSDKVTKYSHKDTVLNLEVVTLPVTLNQFPNLKQYYNFHKC